MNLTRAMSMDEQIDSEIHRNVYLQLGWALKENQKFGRKAGNANKSDYYSEQDIYNELFNLADKREIDRNKIPKTQTIKGCIGRYSRQMKKEAAEKASENIGEGSEGNKKLKM
ncbi:hypothetical protein GLOIN_2v1535525 [Rhizophagus clarus]|uniref:Uncharacterized protein n=1 Tax=Rhizophagus clarus TaxID=94130 RepID=A0A8H3LUR5_9GLOM|nr:hypothetical protein GLOIN_2v1535525 [Rhizophagus clarus]